MSYEAKLKVWRGDDEGGGLHDYSVEVNEGEVVLDIIHRLQAEQAPDLAVRWTCKAGKCGSCSAENTLWSDVPSPGSPFGMTFPVLYLSPFRQSIHISSKERSSDSRISGWERPV